MQSAQDTGQAGAAAGMPPFGGYAASGFVVAPQAIPALRQSIDDIRQRVEQFILAKGTALTMRPLGSDPASLETATLHNKNASSALAAAASYAAQLRKVVSSLDQQAARYHVTETTNAGDFRGGATGA